MRIAECRLKNVRRNRRTPAVAGRFTLQSAVRTLQSALSRFVGDESGQGIIFAAATLLVLVGFVAFVFNIGQLLDRRTKMQIAADAAAYSGAMVEANSVSAIAYINSAMSQVYYNSLKYAVDMNESAVAAELERRMNNGVPGPIAWPAYQTVYNNASVGLQQAKQWMVQLSQLENAIAIVTPRLAEEEMFAVAGRAGGERMSVYPSFRMFPSPDNTISYSIVFLGNGWQVTNLTTGDTFTVQLINNGSTWDFQWSKGGIETQEVQITQNNPTSWQIKFFQPPGSMVQEVSIVNDPNLGWVVSGSSTTGGSMPTITFTPVDMDNEGFNEGVRITAGGSSEVVMHGADGNMYAWNGISYVPMTSNSTTIGGVNVQVNVTNTINFAGGASAQIGNPTTLNVGGTHIVLNNPPNISTGMGPVWIGITGFNPNQFNVSVGGFSLMPGNSNGRWSEHYNPIEELWWRNRLVVMGTGVNGNPNQWQYDYEKIGALLAYETNGGITQHAFMGSGNGYTSDSSTWPAWASTANGATPWFNTAPTVAAPANLTWQPQPADFDQTPSNSIHHLLPALQGAGSGYPPPGAYYQTSPYNSTLGCPMCNGTGLVNGQPCPLCNGWDNSPNGNSTTSNIRVSIAMLTNPNSVIWINANPQSRFPNDFYLSAPMFRATTAIGYPSVPPAPARLPLVATADFFKWGVNIGVWKHAYNGVMVPTDTPMLFPASREPPWGTVAIASARVGLSTAGGVFPDGGLALPNVTGSYLCQFSDADDRTTWCNSSLQNLYYADVQANLFASKNQVSDFDLDDEILQGTPVNAIDQSGLSYLWNAILIPNNYIFGSQWTGVFNGQSDPRVGNALSNMQNRQGASFDYGSAQMNQVVEH